MLAFIKWLLIMSLLAAGVLGTLIIVSIRENRKFELKEHAARPSGPRKTLSTTPGPQAEERGKLP